MLDVETELALGFLDHLLLGTPAAPLRKALMESGLGEAIIGGGIDDDLRQPAFSIGLKVTHGQHCARQLHSGLHLLELVREKCFFFPGSVWLEGLLKEPLVDLLVIFCVAACVQGVAPENAGAVEALVLSTLESLAESGFSAEAVEASINTIEFSLRENNTGSFPRGLALMLRSVGKWLYDRSPFEPLRFAAPLEHFKARLQQQGSQALFGPLIRRYLLDNKHRVTLELQVSLHRRDRRRRAVPCAPSLCPKSSPCGLWPMMIAASMFVWRIAGPSTSQGRTVHGG